MAARFFYSFRAYYFWALMSPEPTGKIIIITAPSGSGKTTLVKRLLTACPGLIFSVSACTRNPRGGEQDGRDYYFLGAELFKQKIAEDAFIEWEMVYEGKYYGTLKTELERIWALDHAPLVDIDVKGALSIQEKYPDNSLTIFIQAPSMEALRERLEKRGTETVHTLEERLSKANFEISFATQFDKIIVNDDINEATDELVDTVKNFLSAPVATV